MMKNLLSLRTTLSAIFFVCVVLAPLGASAQQQEMSVEELEAFVEEQKQLLEEAKANREETESRANAVREALAEQEARREQLEKEVTDLCQELVDAGETTMDECKANFGS